MSQDYPSSIADGSASTPARHVAWVVFACALVIGVGAALYYASQNLTLSHYDARAHLVVSRRVFDSLTPGWRQFGSVWLPLPHLLNLLATVPDWSYRTGGLSVLISIAALGAGLSAVASRIFQRTGSMLAALSGPALVLANPNVLYLQATPMTEPLLFGLTLMSVVAVDRCLEVRTASSSRYAGAVLAALVLTRYEGWLVAGLLIVLSIPTSRRRLNAIRELWLYPSCAIAAFLATSLASTGKWPLSDSFYVPDQELLHQPAVVIDKMWTGFLEVAGWPLAAAGLAGLVAIIVLALRARQLTLYVAMLAPILLPLLGFYSGHPFRVRYLIPMVVAAGVLAAFAIASVPRRMRPALALLVLGAALWQRPPLDNRAAMVLEAQWETPFRLEREKVTAALIARDDGSPILASMGSLAHYMHEASRAGLFLERFLHEGNGDLWADALRSPRRSVRWMLIEQRAEGGDALFARSRDDVTFLSGFERVIEAGGLVLYERRDGQ